MRILLADDHPMFLEALGAQIERLRPDATIALAANLDDILGHARQDASFDLVLVDYHMPGIAGTEGVRKAIEAFPQATVAVVSGQATASNIHAAIQAGARGFVPKTLAPEQFAAAINALLTGTTYVPVDLVRALLDSAPAPEPPDAAAKAALFAPLSDRERQVLQWLTKGLSNKEIGRELDIAEVTVKLHLRQLFKKIGARSRTDAVAIALRAGGIDC